MAGPGGAAAADEDGAGRGALPGGGLPTLQVPAHARTDGAPDEGAKALSITWAVAVLGAMDGLSRAGSASDLQPASPPPLAAGLLQPRQAANRRLSCGGQLATDCAVGDGGRCTVLACTGGRVDDLHCIVCFESVRLISSR